MHVICRTDGKGWRNRDCITVRQVEGVVCYLSFSPRVCLGGPVIAGCETAKNPYLFVFANIQLLPKVQYFLAHSLQLKLPGILVPRPKHTKVGAANLVVLHKRTSRESSV